MAKELKDFPEFAPEECTCCECGCQVKKAPVRKPPTIIKVCYAIAELALFIPLTLLEILFTLQVKKVMIKQANQMAGVISQFLAEAKKHGVM